ncbi:TPA: AzlD domain-containing protein, partial [Acinetobacter baumannii]
FFENNELRGFLDNPYLYATIFCTIVAFCFKKVLPSVLPSLAFFYFINFLINH